jgi:ribosomal protein S18 acetylase RimI-like enzyme
LQGRRRVIESTLAARRASPADADLVTAIIALAFANDPLWSRALARADGRTDHHAAFWHVYVDGALRYPWTWIAGDGEATSIWIPPGGTELSDDQEEQLEELVQQHLGPGASDYRELLSRFDAAHPRAEPHYYLTLLGTHPDHRGKGIGMRLLAHDLELIDAQHLPAYLESSNPANNHRYESVGFEAVGEFSFPGNGPTVTTMWRTAR